jgi:DNA-binding GntR family transcriptional regulator
MDRMFSIDSELHASIAAMSGNSRLERAAETVRAQVHQARLRSFHVKGRASKSLREMAKLTASFRARDGVRAESSMREHLSSLRADLPVIFQ